VWRAAARQYRLGVPEVPRFSWRVLLASTTIALAAAVATYVVLDDGGGSTPASPSQAASLSLTPDAKPQPLDKVTFTDFHGTKVTLASLKGTPLVVNFFASYCTPCITEMPALQSVHDQLGSKVTFLGLAVTDRQGPAQALIKKTKVSYRTAQDKDGSVLATVQGNVLPTTVLIDAAGKIVETHSGAVTADELRALVADKLGVSP
jgi:thiol-disulfide isomerase/thioredoxin